LASAPVSVVSLSSFLFILSFLFFFAVAPSLSIASDAVAEEGEVRVVKATGYGTVTGSNVVDARNMAITDALRKAVEQAVGTVVSSETMVESYRVLKETVYTRSDGFVRSYEILNELQGKNIYTVILSAVVETGAIMDNLDRTGVAYARAGRPRVLFMLSEVPAGSDTPVYWWAGSAKGGPVEIQSESALRAVFLESGFTVIDSALPADAADKSGVGYGLDISDTGLSALAAALNAELVIKGSAIVTLGPKTPGSPLELYMVEITASAVRADTGEVLALSTSRAMLKHVSPTVGPGIAIKQAVDELSERLISQITARWAEPGTVILRLRGVANYEEAVNLKWLLKRRLGGVKAVYQKGFVDGVAYFELQSALSADAVAADISRLLSLSYRVTGTTKNTIDLIAVQSK
jgi:hypothetical protein